MSNIFIDGSMGAAGDMMTAALLELMPDQAKALEDLNSLGLPGIRFEVEEKESYGIKGSHMHVLIHDVEEGQMLHDHNHGHDDHEHECHHDDHHHHHEHDCHDHEHHDHDHTHSHEEAHGHNHEGHHMHDHTHSHEEAHGHHHHMTLKDVQHIVSHLSVSDSVKEQVYGVYSIIAAAESAAHECPVEEVHFHEVGAMDAIADVTAACYLMEQLSPEEVTSSTLVVGNGTVRCAHGILPVPAPATAHIISDIPWCHGDGQGERCTPTGAALVKHFTDRYVESADEPISSDQVKEGLGIGTKDFGKANYLRIVQY